MLAAVEIVAQVAGKGSPVAQTGRGHRSVGGQPAPAASQRRRPPLFVWPQVVVHRKGEIVAGKAHAENVEGSNH
jgi:hypothetical protein